MLHVFFNAIRFYVIWLPGVIQEEGNRQFHRFDITHIHDPYFIYAVDFCKVQLLPYAGKIIRVDPFIISRTAYIIEVIIEAVTAFAFHHIQGWQPPYISPVVVTKQERDVVGHAHAFIIIILYFFVQSPELRSGLGFFAGYFADKFTLSGNDLF